MASIKLKQDTCHACLMSADKYTTFLILKYYNTETL